MIPEWLRIRRGPQQALEDAAERCYGDAWLADASVVALVNSVAGPEAKA